MSSKQCEGLTASGSQCRRRVRACDRYCTIHNISTNIALPSYVSVTSEDRFWIFFPENQQWKVGVEYGNKFHCPGSGATYSFCSYVSEGTYGAVYFGTRLYDNKPVAVKVFKEIFHKGARHKPLDYDFMKEYYMYRAVRDRISTDCVVKMTDAFFIRTKSGLHGALAMEKMDGCLLDLFEDFGRHLNSKLQLEAFRLWVLTCKHISNALIDLHNHKIFHLDIKPGNVLYARTDDGDGITMKLVDLGLSCYIGGTPIVPCVATGSYLPPEWRNNGDRSEPTYARLRDGAILEMGETYAMCMSLCKMLKFIRIGSLKNNKKVTGLIQAIIRGKDDSGIKRESITTKALADMASDILEELNIVLPPQAQGVCALFNAIQKTSL